MKMCQAFQQEGYKTKLLAIGKLIQKNNLLSNIWHHYGIRTKFDIRYIYAFPGIRTHDFCIRAAWQAIRTSQLVYARNLGGAAWCSLFGLPTLYEAHDLPNGEIAPTYFKMLFGGRGFKRLVVISKPLKSLFLQRYKGRLRKSQIVIAPDGVDMERFENLPLPSVARQQLNLPKVQFTAGYAGHLYAGRGINLIMNLAKRLPHVQFFVIGGTDNEVSERKKEAKQKGLYNVVFYGFVPNTDLPISLAACDILLMPYQRRVAVSGGGDTSAWMSPMKMFEYMATERLIISSNLPVLHEVLNEKNAVFCDPDDINAWEQVIKKAINYSEWRESLVNQAREDVKHYTWRRRVQRIMTNIES